MILLLDVWLFPAIAACSASYLVVLAWERVRPQTAPAGPVAAFLAILSFLMGAVCAWYRVRYHGATPENNVIVMFLTGAATTYAWLLLRRFLPVGVDRERRD